MSQFLFFSKPIKWEIEGYALQSVQSDKLAVDLSKCVGSKHRDWFTLKSTVADSTEASFECHFDRYFQYEDGRDHLGQTLDLLVLALVAVSEQVVFVYGSPDDDLAIYHGEDDFLTLVRDGCRDQPVELHLALVRS